jgi:2-oxoglutarate dehydrogenase complex dehydrogenase (E1) component-like enzyme
MVAKNRDRRSVRKLYTETLVNRGDLSLAQAEEALNDFQQRLEAAFAATHESKPPRVTLPTGATEPRPAEPGPPAVSRAALDAIAATTAALPDGFHAHPKLDRLLAARRDMLADDAVDWGAAEMLAFGSLLVEGKGIRLSGQDSRRGTFSQRHAVLVDQSTGAEHVPLQHLAEGQAPFLIYDSLLSEYAVLGFEYGYSLGRPDTLVLWEAQFGDFANGAQIIIDQFIAAAEEKWDQHSRLGLLLPHGYEGQGPEHSSARLERFLQLCARGNLRVAVPSTSAQYFHLLRSQAHLVHAMPLVVLTPKSLLRADVAKSTVLELSERSFQPLLADPEPPAEPRVLVLCSGKVGHDLAEARRKAGSADVAVARVEQLYPFPEAEIAALVAGLPRLAAVRWLQEEPQNMGAWSFVAPRLTALLGDLPLAYVGRVASGSPATGSARLHELEQQRILAAALTSA